MLRSPLSRGELADFGRLTCAYREAITLFTEELPWLTPNDKEWIMGRALGAAFVDARWDGHE